MINLYSSPGLASEEWQLQYPLFSLVRGHFSSFHSLNVPITNIRSALGAHTRNVIPSGVTTAPMPGYCDVFIFFFQGQTALGRWWISYPVSEVDVMPQT